MNNQFLSRTGRLLVAGILISLVLLTVSVFAATYGLMNPDGVVSGSKGEIREVGPSWSPLGEKLAFVSNHEGHYDVYVQNTDGTERKNLSRSSTDASNPVWSPGGDTIAYIAKGQRGFDIHLVNPNGFEDTNITKFPALYSDIVWSPDGTKIAFVSDRDASMATRSERPEVGTKLRINHKQTDVYVMNRDGSDVKRLTSHKSSDTRPAWSPDGFKIAFQSIRDGNSEIYVMRSDGSDLVRITRNDFVDLDPTWSPDGEKIAFSTARPQIEFQVQIATRQPFVPLEYFGGTMDGTLAAGIDFEIYIMNPDGTNAINLSNSPFTDDNRPVWSPNGKYIAYSGSAKAAAGKKFGGSGVYLLRVGGIDGMVPLAGTSVYSETHGGPVWSPNGDRVSYASRNPSGVRIRTIQLVPGATVPRGETN